MTVIYLSLTDSCSPNESVELDNVRVEKLRVLNKCEMYQNTGTNGNPI